MGDDVGEEFSGSILTIGEGVADLANVHVLLMGR